ncbi:MAG: Uma2 family endonuclease [Cyanobacteria bacterium]|nr:Uma2 family endonuclease [Cyanobacteriota bacterium]MDW8201954.1 Uma2 family endonuclease [Cyanobacteriota bacterium SKYGB_h_bin112]
MISLLSEQQLKELELYPESDGKPMAENTEQYRWIVMIKENLEILFSAVPDVFVAADLFWYPVPKTETESIAPQAPDVMVVVGRPKGRRGSYRQWEEANLAPQVVFEILSPGNKTVQGKQEMQQKLAFYQTYGVEEYYIYDPDDWVLEGWQRHGQQLLPIDDIGRWSSPRLGIQFEWQPGQELILRYPDGRPFLSSVELAQQVEQERIQRELAQQQAELAQQQVEQERIQRELAQQRAEQERQRAEQERQRAEQLVAYLRSIGINPDDLKL